MIHARTLSLLPVALLVATASCASRQASPLQTSGTARGVSTRS